MQTYIKICDFYARHIRKKLFFRGNIYIFNRKIDAILYNNSF